MDVGELGRDSRYDEEALEDIRRLFARYRRIAREAAETEREEHDEDAVAVSAGAPLQPAR